MSTTPTRQPETHPDTTATQPAISSLTGAHAKIRTALGNSPGATSAALADAAGIGRSTAGKALTILEQNGLARRKLGGHDGKLRVADRWFPHQPAQADTAEPEPNQEAVAAEPAAPSAQVPDDQPAAQEATAEATGKTEVAPAPEELAAPKLTMVTANGKHRLVPGGLRQLVLNHLQAHPDEHFTATGLSRIIEKSSGAIANALVTLTKQGQAKQVNDRPRRYQLRTSTEQ
jgi:hypothetical protein